MSVKKHTTQPFVLTIFGASGELAKLKIFPALYEMLEHGRMPKDFWIVGYARTKMTKKEFHAEVTNAVEKKYGKGLVKKVLSELLTHVHYFPGQYNDLVDFEKYHAFLRMLYGKKQKVVHLAYFSVPPSAFQNIIRNLALSRTSKREDTRLIIEKPFGINSTSATELFHFVSQYFREDQLFLLDHYLGKNVVRSMLNLRHGNRVLSHMMQGSEISNIQITKFETKGVEERAGYFDAVGIVKDMIQSHLLQLLALITMDIPVAKTANSLQRERLSVISASGCGATDDNVVVGQYRGYKKEHGVPKGSRTETFAAVRFFLNREDWYNVPIYIRTGKKLHESHTYVVVELKKFDFQDVGEEPNRLIFDLAPDEKVSVTLLNKQEDLVSYQQLITSDSIACDMDGCLSEHATLLLDVLHGNHMHFVSFAEVLAAWHVVDDIHETMRKQKVRLESYEQGSTGPRTQHGLTSMDGYSWYDVHSRS
ncbi:MAG: hypothetical protein CO030_03090 [Candidatus Magasanikbacteria bacterium CG_4_9_14_0_2_um_filter_42_11]|uniref:Glucose-6-phosphate 1-dehydrogenase n=1 Tax=Candidatus Magasanikbacteria bacterium CG_4_9_14_0_2_um_filter_42_11 TaxID=1974643 RepID=A0A2M8F9K0_9BACT|nr:MAG: hypothetical protein COU34_05585 [Candidatus Magasanikbacteria bacterium CG10_big_fil_rev_8_21_14_0_10_43_9]PIY92412.1 MAG: hypothetical protein COY70_03475 [Candidatus Magasanikbacteria bacterium CG_4_10_14_0_8_um_filter_42_12]PJC52410.1 MAG: hypothetical protein CO030_03090 [Candidatus Magasanikbacteria bacterium CG_4_9_14_0_2_um_filter_42_11]